MTEFPPIAGSPTRRGVDVSYPFRPAPDSYAGNDDATNIATCTNTAYLTLANVTGGTPLPAEIEATLVTGTAALVHVVGELANSNAGSTTYLAFSVSGATTVASANERSINYESSAADDRAQFGATILVDTLTPGTNTFTLEAKVSSGTGSLDDVRIAVQAL